MEKVSLRACLFTGILAHLSLLDGIGQTQPEAIIAISIASDDVEVISPPIGKYFPSSSA
jgi:hypothetical protein